MGLAQDLWYLAAGGWPSEPSPKTVTNSSLLLGSQYTTFWETYMGGGGGGGASCQGGLAQDLWYLAVGGWPSEPSPKTVTHSSLLLGSQYTTFWETYMGGGGELLARGVWHGTCGTWLLGAGLQSPRLKQSQTAHCH